MAMVDRSIAYRRKARECERAAERVMDSEVQAMYRDMAFRWTAMADRAKAIEKVLADMREARSDLTVSSRPE
jgi:hypothetical protein